MAAVRGHRVVWPGSGHRAGRYGQPRMLRRRPAARLHDRVDRGEPRCVVELVDHVPVGLQGQAGTVTELPRNIVDRAPLMQKQRREAVAPLASRRVNVRSRQLSQVVLVQWLPS